MIIFFLSRSICLRYLFIDLNSIKTESHLICSADDTLNPVKKALKRAEARPRNMAKSMEDMLTSLSPRELQLHSYFSNGEITKILFTVAAIYTFSSPTSGNKRRQDTAAESRRISEGEQKIARSPFSFFYAVTPSPLCVLPPDQLKKSKSVPMDLQEEVKPFLRFSHPVRSQLLLPPSCLSCRVTLTTQTPAAAAAAAAAD